MSEIEVKILNIDIDELRDKFNKMGAKLVKKEKQINHIFDFPGNPLKEKHKGYCRIRETESLIDGKIKYILGIKKMISQEIAKEMVEAETEVMDLDQAINFVKELGLHNRHNNRKIRESYEFDNFLYEIDQWEKDVYPNPYLEIEAENIDELKRAVELIGYRMEDTTSKNLSQLRKDLGLPDIPDIE